VAYGHTPLQLALNSPSDGERLPFYLRINVKWNRTDRLIILALAILVLFFHWRLWTPNLADRQSYLPGDFSYQFWAFTTYEARQLSQGHLPLWNPSCICLSAVLPNSEEVASFQL